MVKWHPWGGTPADLRPVVVLGDGARWIWEHVATLFGSERTEIVDWFHASEHLWTAAKALHGEDTAVVFKRERGYFSGNSERMQYPTLRDRHLPIGSGAVEAAAKHLVQHRIKRAGSEWSDLGARAVLDLRCHLLSGRSLDHVP